MGDPVFRFGADDRMYVHGVEVVLRRDGIGEVAKGEVDRLRTALLSVAAFSKHPHPAPCGTDSCVLCLIESACAEALGDSA
jgi:hypothetical protein